MPMIFPVFSIICTKTTQFAKMSITEIPLSILGSLKPMDLEEYLYNLKVYEKDGMAHTNENRNQAKTLLSPLLLQISVQNEFIQSNPASKVSTPKIHEKILSG